MKNNSITAMNQRFLFHTVVTKSIIAFSLVLTTFFSTSCIKDEGEGGTAAIEGRVFKVVHSNDNFTLKADTFPGSKENVYIVYGNDEIYGDKMEAGYDGLFRFRYLTKGRYYIYAYSTLPSGLKRAVMDTVDVASGKTGRTKDIYIHEGKAYETSYIKGTVIASYYYKGSLYSTIPAYDMRVFIRRVGETYQFDEVRTGSEGVFMFQGLEPGDYEIFVLTEKIQVQELTPVYQRVTVSDKGVIVTMANPFQIIINA